MIKSVLFPLTFASFALCAVACNKHVAETVDASVEVDEAGVGTASPATPAALEERRGVTHLLDNEEIKASRPHPAQNVVKKP